MDRWTRLGVLVLVLTAIGAAKGNLKTVSDEKYKPGQVWSYKTRTDEQGSTLTILRVEEGVDKKRIVHIRVDRIHLRNCRGGPEPESFEHMPFSREALDLSTIKTVSIGPVPDFKNGYTEWRSAWDAGQAGYYTITVAEAIEVAQKNFSHGLGCSE
jgi:hypothetical protein